MQDEQDDEEEDRGKHAQARMHTRTRNDTHTVKPCYSTTIAEMEPHTNTHTHAHTYIHTHAHTHARKLTHTYAHLHTHTRTHILTHEQYEQDDDDERADSNAEDVSGEDSNSNDLSALVRPKFGSVSFAHLNSFHPSRCVCVYMRTPLNIHMF